MYATKILLPVHGSKITRKPTGIDVRRASGEMKLHGAEIIDTGVVPG